MPGRLRCVCVVAVLISTYGCSTERTGITTASLPAASNASATSSIQPLSESQPAASRNCPSPAAPQPVKVPDYPRARWIPAATANYSVADRPHDCPIDMIVIHDTEVSFAKAIRLFEDPSWRASANYIVSAGGQIVQMVSEENIAWHAGNWDYNTRAIGIEHEGHAWTPGSYTEAEYQASARLAASICSRWGLPMDRAHIIGHYQVPDDHHPGLFGGESHRTDPGPYWDWSYYLSLAAAQARALPSPPRMMIDPVAVNGLDDATVTWTPAHSCHLPVSGYTVVAEPSNIMLTLPASATTVTFKGLHAGTAYTFKVTAVNADGTDSLTSNVVVPGRCNAVRLSGMPFSTQPYGSEVSLYGAATGCAEPLYEFALLEPGSSDWTIARLYSSEAFFEWRLAGYAAGSYALRVLVRDASSPGTYGGVIGNFDDYQDLPYTVPAT